jgi:hypothetical protein
MALSKRGIPVSFSNSNSKHDDMQLSYPLSETDTRDSKVEKVMRISRVGEAFPKLLTISTGSSLVRVIDAAGGNDIGCLALWTVCTRWSDIYGNGWNGLLLEDFWDL